MYEILDQILWNDFVAISEPSTYYLLFDEYGIEPFRIDESNYYYTNQDIYKLITKK